MDLRMRMATTMMASTARAMSSQTEIARIKYTKFFFFILLYWVGGGLY